MIFTMEMVADRINAGFRHLISRLIYLFSLRCALHESTVVLQSATSVQDYAEKSNCQKLTGGPDNKFAARWCSSPLLGGHLRLINQENGYAVAHRINAATTGALKRAFISSQGQRLAAFRYGAHQNVEQFLEDHEDIVPARGGKNSDTEARC